jgi:hypothetical protein
MKSTFQIQLGGAPQANRDALVTLANEATGQTLKVKPFLDGSVTVRDLDPGLWKVRVDHPNAAIALFDAPVRLFDQLTPTVVPIRIRPDLVPPPSTTPMADVSPVQRAASSVKERVAPLAGKSPGEAIRAADWNTMAAAVLDLASAVGELTSIVAPLGHHHPDLEQRIDGVLDQLNKFASSFGRSVLQTQRLQQVSELKANVLQVATLAGATPAQSKSATDAITQLESNLDVDSATFTSMLTTASSASFALVNQLALADPTIASHDQVKTLQNTASAYTKAGVAVTPADETFAFLAAKSTRAAISRG